MTIGCVSSDRVQDQITQLCAWMFPHSVLRKSKTASLPYVHIPSHLHRLYMPVLLLSAHVCVHHIAYIYLHTHTRMMTPNTHKMSVNVYAYNSWRTTQNQEKEINWDREAKRVREEVFGARSLEIGSGWWGGLHLQVLEACLPMPMSLHACLVTPSDTKCVRHEPLNANVFTRVSPHL